MEEKKKRGRPRVLTDEERKQKNRESNKRFRDRHPEKIREKREKDKGAYYEPKLRIPTASKGVLKDLLSKTGLSITQLCITAVEEKYGVKILGKRVDKNK